LDEAKNYKSLSNSSQDDIQNYILTILAITILEYVIALLQACVFVNLAMTYLNDCVVPH
jgi:F0F1-type ATP synthase membrane subunit a